MNKTKTVMLFTAVALLLLLVACNGSEESPQQPQGGTGEPVVSQTPVNVNDHYDDSKSDDEESLLNESNTDSKPDNAESLIDDHNDDSRPDNEVSLMDILFDYTFILDGDTITLPLSLEEFMSYGWEPLFDLSEPARGTSHYPSGQAIRNGKIISIALINMNDEEIPMLNSIVCGIWSSCDRSDYPVIKLPGGIILGESTRADVINAYGEPNVASATPTVPAGEIAVIRWIDLTYRSKQGPSLLSNEVRIRVTSQSDETVVDSDTVTEIEITNINLD